VDLKHLSFFAFPAYHSLMNDKRVIMSKSFRIRSFGQPMGAVLYDSNAVFQ
jgi:hypothetical protein